MEQIKQFKYSYIIALIVGFMLSIFAAKKVSADWKILFNAFTVIFAFAIAFFVFNNIKKKFAA